jgi:hypothetical protein
VPPGEFDTPLDPLDEQLAERGRVLVATAVAETQAPLGLRERIEADRSRGAARGRRRRLGVLAPAAGVLAAAVLAIVLVTGGGGPGVVATASLAARGPVLPAPTEDRANGAVLNASVEGVPFPYWDDSFQWKAVGARDDKIDDRAAKTVYYENAKGVRAAYTILGGDAIDAPSKARKQTANGITFWVLEDSGRRIVTWKRGAHTCVLSAPATVPENKLLELASWKGKGRVPF